jgi:hypothetical protein
MASGSDAERPEIHGTAYARQEKSVQFGQYGSFTLAFQALR